VTTTCTCCNGNAQLLEVLWCGLMATHKRLHKQYIDSNKFQSECLTTIAKNTTMTLFNFCAAHDAWVTENCHKKTDIQCLCKSSAVGPITAAGTTVTSASVAGSSQGGRAPL